MRSESSWSRRPLVVLGAALAVPVVAVFLPGCEDQLEPRAYLGAAEPPAYTAPPVYTPGIPTAQPAPTDGLVEPPPGVVEPCTAGAASSEVPLAPDDAASLGLAERLFLVVAGTTQSLPLSGTRTGCPDDDAPTQPAFPDIGPARALDARGPSMVAGSTGVAVTAASGSTFVCDLPGAKAVARTPGTDTGYAITGSRDLFALDWSGEACVVTPVALASSLPNVLGTLALGTSASSGAWIATAERDTSAGASGGLVARARRFDATTGAFDELSPSLGGQLGTICGLDALAVTDDGERVAIIDGACGRVLVFRASDGELLAGVSLRARALAPVPGERAFVTVTSAAGKASYARLDAP